MLASARSALVAAATLVVAFGSASPALAQSSEGGTCLVDSDCAADLLCEVVGGAACVTPACADGAPCDPVPPCEPIEYRECVAPPCVVDADCGPGLTCASAPATGYTACVPKACVVDADCGDASLECIEERWEECTGTTTASPDCAPGETCPDPILPDDTTVTCETYRVRFCGPTYMGSCTSDADCGEGFDCAPLETCTCAAPPPAEPGDITPVPVDETCTCAPTDTNYCEPLAIECLDDAGCPSGWTCDESPAPMIACDPAATSCPEPLPAPRLCEPPSWGGIYFQGVASAEGGPAYAFDGGAVPTEPEVVTPAPSPATPGANDDARDSGGCQVTAASASSSTWAGLLLGLAGLSVLRMRGSWRRNRAGRR